MPCNKQLNFYFVMLFLHDEYTEMLKIKYVDILIQILLKLLKNKFKNN